MRLITTNDMSGIKLFVAFSDKLNVNFVPGDSRRAILSVAFGDSIAREFNSLFEN